MNNFLRTIIAGYGAKKLGGGCISTILIFIVIYWALGNCLRRRGVGVAQASVADSAAFPQESAQAHAIGSTAGGVRFGFCEAGAHGEDRDRPEAIDVPEISSSAYEAQVSRPIRI